MPIIIIIVNDVQKKNAIRLPDTFMVFDLMFSDKVARLYMHLLVFPTYIS